VTPLTIVDTDVIIDAGRSVREALVCLSTLERKSTLAISVITQMEIWVGCRNKTEQRYADKFLRRFQVLALTEQVCDVAVDLLRRYRLSHGLAIPDALIAATAIAVHQPFVSKNNRDYRFIEGVQLLPYPLSTAT